MSLLVPSKSIGLMQYTEGSHEATRPDAIGTTITPGNNTYGTAVQVGADVVEDLWAIEFGVHGIGVAATAKNALVQIGFDFSGGTTFPASPDRYNSITLLASCAAPYLVGGGLVWWFPLGIPAGTAILARASVNNVTVGTASVWWRGWGRPKYPEVTRRGQYVESLGATPASSSGTTITPGTTSEGTAVLLGTLDADHCCWYWEFGYGVNDSTIGNTTLHCDLLAGSATGDVILRDGIINFPSTGEVAIKKASIAQFPYAEVPGGTGIYGRAQSSGAADASVSMMAYGVGG